GSPGRRAHHALATLHDSMAGKQVSYGLAAARRPCFGSLDHPWARRCRPLRVGEPRMRTRMRRGLNAGVLRPEGAMAAGEWGPSPRGQSPWAPEPGLAA